MRCAFCNATVSDVDEAIEAEWKPSYWTAVANGSEISKPVCPQCQTEHCDADGNDLVLKPGHQKFVDDSDRDHLTDRIRAALPYLTNAQLRAAALLIGA